MIFEALHAYAMTSGRQWSTDRTQTVGASEIGGCCRRVAFEKHQADEANAVTRDSDYEESWGASRRGSVIEDAFWAPAMRARFGDDLLWAGPEQQTFVSGYLSATPDGVLVNQPVDALADLGVANCGGQILLDCKSSDPRTRLDKPKESHVYQVIVGMGVLRETTNYKPEWAVLSYIDASLWDRIIEFPVAFDPDVYAVAKDRARQIMTARHGADLKPEGVIAGGKECDFCGFTRQCGVARAAQVPDAATEIAPEIAERIRSRATLIRFGENDIKRIEREIGEHKQNIRDDLRAASSKSLPGVVSWASVKGRKSYDYKAMAEDAATLGLDVEKYAKEGDQSDRLIINLKV